MNKIVNIFIMLVFGISLYLAFFYKERNEPQYNTIKFHYKGEMKCSVALDKSGSSYIEDSSVKNLKGGIVSTEEMSAKLSIIIMNSFFYDNSDHKASLPITVVNVGNKRWWNSTWLPRGADGGRGSILIQRSNSKILLYGHTK
ncbi:hypothetical protein [Prevotella sp.]|uniref:hypothetical protein n=1 Tax=Prevotella sp. TaxID=59823 RepID=UPI003FD739E3